MSTLLTGGCGYIGRQLAWALHDVGQPIIILDDLSTGDATHLPPTAVLVVGDVRDGELLRRVLEKHSAEAVIHLAGSISVTESMERPELYFANNTGGTAALVDACRACGVNHLVFSSTAAVYGTPERTPVKETDPANPISPYGQSKLFAEEIILASAKLTGLRAVILRYFNVAGADPQGRTGQTHPNAAHLIMNAMKAAQGRHTLQIFGDDYDTPDGTGVRDFIHVADLAEVHLRALSYLKAGGSTGVFNCGDGRGYSVREVVAAVERTVGRTVPTELTDRRPGDIPAMIADPSLGQTTLGWRPAHAELDAMIQSAWRWENRTASAARSASSGEKH